MKSLFVANIVEKEHRGNKDKRRVVYIVANDLIKAVTILEEKISVDEMILDCNLFSEECYV